MKFFFDQHLDFVLGIYTRACEVVLPRNPRPQLDFASFEEGQGEHERARRILDSLLEREPLLVEALLERAELERRYGHEDVALELLLSYSKRVGLVNSEKAYIILRRLRMLLVLDRVEEARQYIREELVKSPRVDLLAAAVSIESDRRQIDAGIALFNLILYVKFNNLILNSEHCSIFIPDLKFY